MNVIAGMVPTPKESPALGSKPTALGSKRTAPGSKPTGKSGDGEVDVRFKQVLDALMDDGKGKGVLTGSVPDAADRWSEDGDDQIRQRPAAPIDDEGPKEDEGDDGETVALAAAAVTGWFTDKVEPSSEPTLPTRQLPDGVVPERRTAPAAAGTPRISGKDEMPLESRRAANPPVAPSRVDQTASSNVGDLFPAVATEGVRSAAAAMPASAASDGLAALRSEARPHRLRSVTAPSPLRSATSARDIVASRAALPSSEGNFDGGETPSAVDAAQEGAVGRWTAADWADADADALGLTRSGEAQGDGKEGAPSVEGRFAAEGRADAGQPDAVPSNGQSSTSGGIAASEEAEEVASEATEESEEPKLPHPAASSGKGEARDVPARRGDARAAAKASDAGGARTRVPAQEGDGNVSVESRGTAKGRFAEIDLQDVLENEGAEVKATTSKNSGTTNNNVSKDGMTPVAEASNGRTDEVRGPARTETPTVLNQRLQEMIETIVREKGPGGREQVAVRLHPEHLGRLLLQVRIDEAGVVHTRFVADSAAVRTMIEQDLGQLRTALSEHGLVLGDADVEADVGSHGHGPGDFFASTSGGQSFARHPSPESDVELVAMSGSAADFPTEEGDSPPAEPTAGWTTVDIRA